MLLGSEDGGAKTNGAASLKTAKQETFKTMALCVRPRDKLRSAGCLGGPWSHRAFAASSVRVRNSARMR